MIPAATSPWFLAWFARDAEKRIRRAFGEIRIQGLATLKEAAATSPVLVVTNHTSWWDPLVVLFVTNRLLDVTAFAMMDQRNLRRLPFFAKVGAFGVNLTDPSDGARGMRYAAKRLASPRSLVWIFPQGKEVSAISAPLAFHAGSAQIERLAPGARVVPGAIRYVFGDRPEPSLWISFGEPYAAGRDVEENLVRQRTRVEAACARIDAALLAGDPSFETLQRSKTSWLLSLGERLLSRLTRRAIEQGHTSPRS